MEGAEILLRTVLTGAAVLALDLFTKYLVQSRMAPHQSIPVIRGFFHITYVYNPGAAFGMLAHWRWFFVATALAVIAGILVYSRRPEVRQGLLPYALGMVMGGAAGNMVDRLRYGTVVDFLDFFWGRWHFPVFNVADTFIVTGVGLVLLVSFLEERRRGESR